MTPAAALHPRLAAQATPITVLPLASDRHEVQRQLGVNLDQMHPIGDAVLSAKIEVPPGEWLVWLDLNSVMWIGARGDALPPVVRRRLAAGEVHNVIDQVHALADVGVWLREAALLIGDAWTPSRRADYTFAAASTLDLSALSGIFVDRAGRAARLEATCGGVWWTDHPRLAVEWLLTAFGLSAPL
jgi:hypothetical protein